MSIVFMGTPEFAVPSLVSLYENGYDISLVVTQKDKPKGRGKRMQPTPVKEKALELGLEVYQPGSINSIESLDKLKKLSPECIIVVAFGQKLKREVLNMPEYGCINIHASLLPKYRGAAPINWAIINGENETGITIMEMNEGLDTGDMLYCEQIPIGEDDDSQSIHDKLSILGSKLIIETLEELKKGNIIKSPQDNNLATYAPMLTKKTGIIGWNNSGEKIKNLIRGLKPWPSAYTIYKDEIIKVHKATTIEKFSDQDNGVVIKVSDKGVFVNCQDSCIVIEELQFPGKKKLHVSDYLKGNKFKTNVKLG